MIWCNSLSIILILYKIFTTLQGKLPLQCKKKKQVKSFLLSMSLVTG